MVSPFEAPLRHGGLQVTASFLAACLQDGISGFSWPCDLAVPLCCSVLFLLFGVRHRCGPGPRHHPAPPTFRAKRAICFFRTPPFASQPLLLYDFH
jgi:hypothetical protein